MSPAMPTSPPDFTAIGANLAIVLAAVAAVIGGLRKGLKEVKKGGADTNTEVVSGLIMDGVNVRKLIDSNQKLCEANHEILDLLKSIDRNAERLVESLKDHREMTRSQLEEQHRLRAATVDLVDVIRRRL